MKTIPQIRNRLLQLAAEHGIQELAELAEETRRRRPFRVAPRRRKNPDAVRVAEIRAFAATHPTASHEDMAERFRTSIGRISEALVGKRENAA